MKYSREYRNGDVISMSDDTWRYVISNLTDTHCTISSIKQPTNTPDVHNSYNLSSIDGEIARGYWQHIPNTKDIYEIF